MNPGLACHAYNTRTLSLLQDMQRTVEYSIEKKLFGWGQLAYDVNFCQSDFEYSSADADSHKWHWRGVLHKQNASVVLFTALAPGQAPSARERSLVPSYHAKSCHGVDMSNALARVRCKETWLKEQGQWFLPDNLPTTMDGWLNMDKALLLNIQHRLFVRGSAPIKS